VKTESPRLSVGAFADAAGVNVETIRFYQRKGLLPTPDRAYGTTRRYGGSDVARVRFVKSAQRLGFTLEEIRSLLTLDDGTHCAEARVLAEQKLIDVRGKLDDLRRIETALSRLAERCGASRGTITCPLIAALHRP
jgi:MerR family transcriptional regulator, mercuric resistance operon regulatory protein